MSDKGFSMESITGSKSTLVVLIGAAIALLGSFMNWVTVSGGGISVSAGGMSDGGDGVITLIVAIGTAAAAIFLKDKARIQQHGQRPRLEHFHWHRPLDGAGGRDRCCCGGIPQEVVDEPIVGEGGPGNRPSFLCGSSRRSHIHFVGS